MDTLVEMDKWRNWGGEEGNTTSTTRGDFMRYQRPWAAGVPSTQPEAKAPDVCATHYSLQTGHIIWASQPPKHLRRAHVYSSFHRFGNRFKGWIPHPRSQSRNLSLKFHIQRPFLQTHTVLSLRQPRLECSKEAETRFCSCTGILMGRGGSLQKGGPDVGIMNYSTAIFFSTSHSILEDSPGCSGFPWAPRLSDDST